jgi:hypothetical protein
MAAAHPRGNPFLRMRDGLGGEMLAEFFGTFILVALGDGSVGDERMRNLITVVGGKLTTHRSLAEQAVDLVFESLGRALSGISPAGQPATRWPV